jgi:hypothetical protein
MMLNNLLSIDVEQEIIYKRRCRLLCRFFDHNACTSSDLFDIYVCNSAFIQFSRNKEKTKEVRKRLVTVDNNVKIDSLSVCAYIVIVHMFTHRVLLARGVIEEVQQKNR